MKPIRVLQAFTILNRGGAETMIMNYYRNIDRSKVQFDFLVHRQERGAYEEEIEALGGRIYRMSRVHPRYFSRYKREIRAFFEEHKEYKIIHGNFSELGYFLYREAKAKGIPTIICHAHNSKMSFDVKAPFRFYWKHACRNYITHMFSCSKQAAVWLFGKKNADKTIMMNNAIEASRFSFDREKANQKKCELGVADKFVIGHVGRFNIQKNHKFLIDIFYEVKKKCDNAVLMLVGQGELEQDIVRKVTNLGLQDSVMFLGSCANVHEILQVFDLFLFPSLFEGLPVSVVEAQAAGLKCIISDKVPQETAITDLVEFVPLSESAEYWAERALTYKTGYNRKKMAEEIVNSGFDIKKNARWLEQFYLEQYSNSR